MTSDDNYVAIGDMGIDIEPHHQTIIGVDVQGDGTSYATYIGCGAKFLKIAPDGTVTLHGTKDVDEAVEAVLDGLSIILGIRARALENHRREQ